jgi:hypothetical protein
VKYLLIAQFPEEKYGDLDWIHPVEDKLIAALMCADVDGHDVGSGEVNFFIYTDQLMQTLEIVKKTFAAENALADAKIAYREAEAEDELYIGLWPEGLTAFKVI